MSKKKVKKPKVEKSRTQCFNMAIDDFDDVVEDTHKINVEHGDLLTKRQHNKYSSKPTSKFKWNRTN